MDAINKGIIVTVWADFLLSILFDFCYAWMEKRKLSAMSQIERMEYLLGKYGRDVPERFL